MADEDEAANAPLITDGDRPIITNNNGSILLQESNYASPTAFIWALTFAAGISGLLFGYEYAYTRSLSSPALTISPAPASYHLPSSPSAPTLATLSPPSTWVS